MKVVQIKIYIFFVIISETTFVKKGISLVTILSLWCTAEGSGPSGGLKIPRSQYFLGGMIKLTDLPKSGGAMAPLAPQEKTPLDYQLEIEVL